MASLYAEYDCLITFLSVHQAIAAERKLSAVGVAYAALPTPREISVSCGQCLAFERTRLDEVIACLTDERISWSKVFSRNSQRRIYEQIVIERS